VDASTSAAPPFEFLPATPRRDASCSTHAMSPEALLETHRTVVGQPPESWVLAIRGERFELGEPLSAAGRAHLDAAVDFFVTETRGPSRGVKGRRLTVQGTVQGVGFRPWVHRTARALGLTGSVCNTAEGLSIEAFGDTRALDALVRALQHEAPRAARIRAVRSTPIAGPAPADFAIVPSRADGREATRALGPDLALCDECAREIADPAARRHDYPFTTCAACGPRLAVACALPYDRAATTMVGFLPCPACAREYADPEDRRFHAQTIACPACGPRVWLADASGAPDPSGADPLDEAAARLRAGQIVGVQGLGAFHLMCDATSAAAVARLRQRKRRDAQPFAIMVRDEAMARVVAELDDVALEALRSDARPIVLAPARGGSSPPIARAVNGPSGRTGVMLPYTPLHALLAERLARPLVVTSGNRSGGPAVIDHAEARAVLGDMVDVFLFHDRPIARRVEDSVVARTAGGVRVLRRARGLAAAPVRLPFRARAPVLAVGGHMKSTACVVVGDEAYLTPHLGDLGLIESETAWQRDVEGFEQLLGVRADVLAHDLHPEYSSTRYALARPAARRVSVQHHVAHVLAAVAELHLDEPVVGVVFDGSGWGSDGTSWGAELLIVDGLRWTRAASFRPIGLPGGEHAIRDVWRVALAALLDAFGPEEGLAVATRLRVFDSLPPASLATVARQLEEGIGTVRARGMGRWFDAIGALTLEIPRAHFDAHVALALEEAGTPDLAAAAGDAPPYPVTLPIALAAGASLTADHEVDLRPTVRAAVSDLLADRPRAEVSARFHRTVVDATMEVTERILETTGVRRVVLSGGSFQNRLLERGLADRIGAGRLAMAREVPVNDGGLALGQAWAAVLTLETGAAEKEVR
jgi:hydrogenase maturation protein HypF